MTGVNITRGNIRDIHRIPTYKKEGPLPIIASFSSILIKKAIMESYYEKKMKIDASELGNYQSKRVFLATHLTPHMKQLFKMARDLKDDGVKYVWERNGTILARISDNDTIVKITSENSIHQLKMKLSESH